MLRDFVIYLQDVIPALSTRRALDVRPDTSKEGDRGDGRE